MSERDFDLSLEISDLAPTGGQLTDYDRERAPLYVRLLDAEQARVPWEEVARWLLGIDPDQHRDRARLRYETHLTRAHWMRDEGYAQLAQQRAH
jgi:hypothetical protein